MAFISTMVLVACEDDFTEEDFLNQQNKLALEKAKADSAYLASLNKQQAEEYVAALNASGDLMAVTILVREDGAPISGATVTFTGGEPEAIGNGRTQVTASATSGADGNAVFDRLPIGRHTVVISKTGYASASAQVNFGTPGAPIAITTTVNGITRTTFIAPIKRFENLAFPLFSTDASSTKTATVNGTVTFENDLTNLTPEIPQNLTLKADLSFLVNYNSPSGSVSVTQYQLNSTGLGSAVVNNSTGAYSMLLPASASGYANLRLLVPELTGTQRIAVNAVDDGTGNTVTIPTGPEFRNIPTKWGGNATGFTNVPFVFGAKAVFPAPPAAGKGFTFDFTAQPRSLTAGTINTTTNDFLGSDIYKITNRGAYTGTPTVAISGGGGTVTIQPLARMRAAVTSITRTAAGSGYTFMNVNLVKVDALAVETVIGDFAVTPVTGGLPATFDPSTFINEFSFGTNSPATNIADAASFKLTVTGNGTGATVSGTISVSLDRVIISDIGSGFTSAPTITLTGGGGTTQATIQSLEFPVQWNLIPNNAGNTVDYSVMPDDLYLYFPPTATSGGFSTSSVDYHSSGIGTLESSFQNLYNSLTASGGDINLINPGIVLRTSNFWAVKPQVVISDETPRVPEVFFYISNTNTGEIDINFWNDFGNGYNTPFQMTIQPSIAGAPGVGAQWLIQHSFNSTSGEYSLNSWNRLSGGSGYLDNLNRKGQQSDNISTTGIALPTLQAGSVYVVDVTYGTGFKTIDVD